jgi:hypothetical protein
MKSVTLLNIYHNDFVADFVLTDGADTYTVSVAWDEWDGFSVIAQKNTHQTFGYEVARTFGFEDENEMARALSNAVAPVRTIKKDVTDKVLPKEVAQ